MALAAVMLVFAILSVIDGVASEHDGHAAAPAPEAAVAEAHAPGAKPAVTPAAAHSAIWRWLAGTPPALIYKELDRKVGELAHMDEQNEFLRKRVSELELENSRLATVRLERSEQARAEKLKEEAVAEGGIETARTIASLKTGDERLLQRPPKQIFETASQAFAGQDYETAAKAFAFLVDNSENDAYQDAQTFYLAGVSLYKVGNYRRALGYLEKALRHAEGENASYGPRALGWAAICYKKLGDAAGEKKTVRELIQKFPTSQEARRLNRNA